MENNLNGWKPIETSPRDGTKIILGYVPKPQGKYAGGEWVSTIGKWAKGGFLADGNRNIYPTHWMPLPKAPK